MFLKKISSVLAPGMLLEWTRRNLITGLAGIMGRSIDKGTEHRAKSIPDSSPPWRGWGWVNFLE